MTSLTASLPDTHKPRIPSNDEPPSRTKHGCKNTPSTPSHQQQQTINPQSSQPKCIAPLTSSQGIYTYNTMPIVHIFPSSILIPINSHLTPKQASPPQLPGAPTPSSPQTAWPTRHSDAWRRGYRIRPQTPCQRTTAGSSASPRTP